MAKIKDVAKAAGVSVATVSRVLNNKPQVTEDRRKRVLKAIKDLHYVPNLSSQNLRKQETKTILVIIPDIRNNFYANILYGMDIVCMENEYNLIIASSYSDINIERRIITRLKQHMADGIIFMASTLSDKELTELDSLFPVVQLCEYYAGTSISHISIDNYKAAYDATKYLIDSGHKRIGLLSATNKFISTQLREEGYKKALIDNSLSIDTSLIRKGSYSFDSGYLSTSALMKTSNPPTAIFAVSDLVASGALHALYNIDKKVPSDIAIMGFDNIDIARQITPPLSTVSQPLEMLGKTAAHSLIDKIKGQCIDSEIILPYELTIRGTT